MKTLMHYFKTRALRQIVQWLVVAAVSIFVLGAFAVADAYAIVFEPPPTMPTAPTVPIAPISPITPIAPIVTLAPISGSYVCADLGGSTDNTCAIDEGCMNFDYDDVNEDTQPDDWAAEICGPTVAYVGDVLQPFELHGWVWDMNLGYVSLYCDETGFNNGAPCGGIEYGVKVDPDTGEMSGWAYSDNMGWISFMCEGGLNDGYACGDIDYYTTMETRINSDLGKIAGYAWTDTVGWFEFETGDVHAKMLDIMMRSSSSETDWGVWTKAEIDDDDLSDPQKDGEPLKNTMPFADGNPGYEIFLHIATIGGTPVQGSIASGVELDIATQWDDNVDMDSTSTGTDDSYPDNNDGAVRKPGIPGLGYDLKLNGSAATTGGVVDSWWNTVRSVAPTDGGNCYDGNGDGSCFGGEGDALFKDVAGSANESSLTYYGADVTITITDTGETWHTYVTPLAPYQTGRKLEFRPIVDIPTLDYLYIPGDDTSGIPVIQAIRNKVDEFIIDATDNGTSLSYSINLGLSEDEADVEYVFIETLDQDPSTGSSTLPPITNVASLGAKLLAMPFSQDEEMLNDAIDNARLTSVIEVTSPGGTVKYYNNGLPRVFDSNIATQMAEIISGSVFSPGAKDVVQGSDVPLFGDTAVYELRTSILEDVSELIRGAKFDGLLDVTISDGTTSADLYRNEFKDGRFYYFEDQDVTIESLAGILPANGDPMTIAVKGGDVYIRNDIDYPDQEIGIIAFESDTDTNQATKGGRVYIHSSVTDMVNVHIFTDGPVFRYSDGICYNTGTYNGLEGLREPNYADSSWCAGYQEPTEALPNQFYLKGNIASFNCLGCSTDLAPSRGDGQDLGGPSALNFAIARLYDFNYFSYFRIHPVTGADSGDRSTNVTGNPNVDNEDGAVYFEYSPAPTDLYGFRNF